MLDGGSSTQKVCGSGGARGDDDDEVVAETSVEIMGVCLRGRLRMSALRIYTANQSQTNKCNNESKTQTRSIAASTWLLINMRLPLMTASPHLRSLASSI